MPEEVARKEMATATAVVGIIKTEEVPTSAGPIRRITPNPCKAGAVGGPMSSKMQMLLRLSYQKYQSSHSCARREN